MASLYLPQAPARVSPTASRLLSMVSGVDSYHQAVAVAGSFNETQMQMTRDEFDGLSLVMRGLRKLFPFDPERDQEHQITPRHAL